MVVGYHVCSRHETWADGMVVNVLASALPHQPFSLPLLYLVFDNFIKVLYTFWLLQINPNSPLFLQLLIPGLFTCSFPPSYYIFIFSLKLNSIMILVISVDLYIQVWVLSGQKTKTNDYKNLSVASSSSWRGRAPSPYFSHSDVMVVLLLSCSEVSISHVCLSVWLYIRSLLYAVSHELGWV